MPRFFVLPDAISESEIRISGDDAYHIARALRMAVGDEITIADGRMNEYLCRLSRIRDEECLCEIINTRHAATEPPHEITLYMAYPKGDKMETVTQKAVELGASHIVPFESERCIKRPSGDKADKIAAQYAIPAVAKMPLDARISTLADAGRIEDYETDALKDVFAQIEKAKRHDDE